jgi:putative SOS response-associated peptidase YedK
MCGRYGLTRPEKLRRETFGLDALPQLDRRWNIAPTQAVAAVLARDGRRTLELLHWGLVPPWAEDPAIGNRMINARGETITERPAYRSAFRHRRCLLPADVFYEWQAAHGLKSRLRQPYAIRRRDGAPFALAGVWEEWRPKGEGEESTEPLRSCAIVTTTPNAVMAPIHDRMPVIIAPEDYDVWLDPETPLKEAAGFLRPAPEEWLEAYAISTYVNDPRHDEPQVLERVDGEGGEAVRVE